MFVVHKEVLNLQRLSNTDTLDVLLPEGSSPLTVAEQYGQAALWFQCDSTRPKTARRFALHGTGHGFDHHGRYLGTAILHGGSLVLHVYDLGWV